MEKTNKKLNFTLLELVVALAVFIIIILVIGRFYSSTIDATNETNKKSMMFENARIAMDLMTRDIQSIYYVNGSTPFWHWRPLNPASPPPEWKNNRNEFIAFVSASSITPDNSSSSYCEIKYQKYYATNHNDDNDGWLKRSIVGDYDSTRWNYSNNFTVGYKTNPAAPVSAFTGNSTSSGEYQKLIPYVTDLTFTCYDKNGSVISSDNTTSSDADACTVTEFPFSIEINLTLMDKNSWQKWVELDTANNPNSINFKKNNERLFTKAIVIGNRGQYD